MVSSTLFDPHSRTIFPYSKADFNARPDHDILAISVCFQVLHRENPDDLDDSHEKSECEESGEDNLLLEAKL
jgi:hypothetical protein